eukprot:Gb_25072 [translate_table: standard]
MSQSPMTHLESDEEDFLFVSTNEVSPIPKRKLKRLKKAGIDLVSEKNAEKQNIELMQTGPCVDYASGNGGEFSSDSQLPKRKGSQDAEQHSTSPHISETLDQVEEDTGHDIQITDSHNEREPGKPTPEKGKGKKKSRSREDATQGHVNDGEEASSPVEKKKKRRKAKPEGKDTASAPDKKGQKKTKKSELEEIHAESQRLLRETRDASFKPQPAAGKSISSVLEKIRLRKLQLEQKVAKEFVAVSKNSGDDDARSEDFSDSSDHMESEDDYDEPLQNKEDNVEDVDFRAPSVDDNGIPKTPENYSEMNLFDKGLTDDIQRRNDGFRPPVEDTQDLFCNSQISFGEDQEENPDDSTEEEDVLAPALLSMNLKLDSHPQEDELFDDGDNKENVDPSPSKPVEASLYAKGAPVKAFVDDEAEDEDEDILVGHDEDDVMDDENEDLQDIVATAEEEKPIDHERRDALHRKWLEEQDAAMTGDIFQRLGRGRKQKGPQARKTALLDEDDDVDFDDNEDDMVESDDEPQHHRAVSKEADHNDDDSNMEKLPTKTAIDEEDVLDLSDDDEMEQRLVRQRILEESEEQEVFLAPADDESSREVFGLIKKVNIANSKKKTKPASTSTFLEALGAGGNSNSSSKSSFLGRATSSSLQLSHKQGLSGSRSFIFGRDDSNSRHGISKTERQEEMDQKENDHSTDDWSKGTSTQSKAKKNEFANKKTNNATDFHAGPSLFEILRRQTSDLDRTLQSRNTNTIQEHRQTDTISHFAAFKASKSNRTFRKIG